MSKVTRLFALVLGVLCLNVGPSGAPSAAIAATTRKAATPVKSITRPFKPRAKVPGEEALTVIDNNLHVTGPQYRDLREASLALLKRFNPAKHYFIGLGRDPAPIIAFLQNLGGRRLAVNFPASSNEAGSDTPDVLAAYVKKIIPAAALSSGKTLVFVDVTSSGRALNHYVPRLTPHLGGKKVLRVAFGVSGGGIHMTPGENQVIPTSAFPEVDQFYYPPYEGITSEYERHAPGYHAMSEIETPRPQYQQYKDALMLRMAADRALDKELTGLGVASGVKAAPAKRPARITPAQASAAKRRAPEGKTAAARKRAHS